MKRVVGLPGETISDRNGKVYIDGKALDETYLPKNDPATYTAPFGPRPHRAEQLFRDGRQPRPTRATAGSGGRSAESEIIGKVEMRIWPIDAHRLLPNLGRRVRGRPAHAIGSVTPVVTTARSSPAVARPGIRAGRRRRNRPGRASHSDRRASPVRRRPPTPRTPHRAPGAGSSSGWASWPSRWSWRCSCGSSSSRPSTSRRASMTPTLKVGDRILVNKLAYHLHGVGRGDIIVFKRPPAENCGTRRHRPRETGHRPAR